MCTEAQMTVAADNSLRTKLSQNLEGRLFSSLRTSMGAIISSFVAEYCALVEKIFYFRDVHRPERSLHARLVPVPLQTSSAAKARRSLAHHDILQRDLIHVVDRPRHAAAPSVLVDERSPDDIGGPQAAVLKNADASHRLWRNPGLSQRAESRIALRSIRATRVMRSRSA
jgi:hypothetical protein